MRLVTVWGIPVRLHWSLLFLVPMMLVQARAGMGLPGTLFFTTGILASIALHELGHSLVALKLGCRVREILLTPVGGVAQIREMPTRPRGELLMAAAGPAVSLFLFGILFRIGAWLPLPVLFVFAPDFPINHVQLLGLANLVLALFNLLPSFPMDGGRILRAALAGRIGRVSATRVAMKIGRVIAVGLFVLGLRLRHVTMMLISVLVYVLAGVEYRMVRRQAAARRFADARGGYPEREAPEDDDRVVIGPPPFDRQRPTRSDLEKME